jgi:hypothetical protein
MSEPLGQTTYLPLFPHSVGRGIGIVMRARHVAAFAVVSSFAPIAAAEEPEATSEEPEAVAEAPVATAGVAAESAEPPASEGAAADAADGATPVRGGKDSGVELGIRLGWGFPLGDASGENEGELSTFVLGQIPLHMDLGYRLNPHIFLGGYFQYGVAFPGDDCTEAPGNPDCAASDVRIGIQGIYHFTPITTGNSIWVGAGIGYEWLSVTREVAGVESTTTRGGFEFLNVQAGYDFEVSEQFRVGPYGMFTLAQFSNLSTELDGLEEEADFDKALHEWLFVGVKGTFGPI